MGFFDSRPFSGSWKDELVDLSTSLGIRKTPLCCVGSISQTNVLSIASGKGEVDA
jgi:hypothetical protein